MKANADNLTKPRWFRALTTLGQALRRPHCASPVEESASEPNPPTRARQHSQLSIMTPLRTPPLVPQTFARKAVPTAALTKSPIVRTAKHTGNIRKQIGGHQLRSKVLALLSSQQTSFCFFTRTTASFAILFYSSLNLLSQEPNTTGTIRYKSYLNDDSAAQFETVGRFEVWLGDTGRWRMRHKMFSTSFEFVEMAYDGTNTYELIFNPSRVVNAVYTNKMPTHPLGVSPNATVVGSSVNDGIGRVVEGEFPYPNFTPASIMLWWAFVFPAMFSEYSTHAPLPSFYTDIQHALPLYVSGWAPIPIFNGSPFISLQDFEMTFRNDGFKRSFEDKSLALSGAFNKTRQRGVLGDGWTNCTVALSGTQFECGNWRYYDTARFAFQGPRLDESREVAFRQLEEFLFECNNHSDATGETGKPFFGTVGYISDYRFIKEPQPLLFLRYLGTNGWPTKAEVTLRSEFAVATSRFGQQVFFAKGAERVKSVNKWVRLILFTCVALGGIATLCFIVRRSEKNKTT